MNKKYWKERAEERMGHYHKDSDETINKVNKAYNKAIEDINADIKKIFEKFVIESGLDPGEARKILNTKVSKKTMDEIREKIKHITDGEIKKLLWAELNSNAYKARITKLEALKESIAINTAKVADVEKAITTTGYVNSINNAYSRSIFDIQKGIGLGFDVSSIPTSRINEIIKNNWSGKNYSERIWNNRQVLADKLEETLLEGMTSGKSINKMSSELGELSEYGKHAAERLVRTETTYIANQAELAGYEECDIEKYVFVATLDLRTSSVCRKHDNKICEVSKGVPGENLPPLHPYCRSTTIAYMGKEWYDNLKRRARDPETGKNYVLHKNMTYDEWYQKHIVEKYGKNKTVVLEKMTKNKSADKNQFEKYKEVLGKELPKTLDDFQELKYNNSKEWEVKKREYSTMGAISNKEWSNMYKEKVKGAYYDFRKDNVELSWHGAQRFVDRNKDKSGNIIFTQKDIVSIFNNKPNYSQEDGRLVNFQNGIAIIRNNKTNEIVSIVNRKNPKKEWIEND